MVLQAFERDYEAAATWQTPEDDWLSSKWSGFKSPRQRSRIRETGVDIHKLKKVLVHPADMTALLTRSTVKIRLG
jgi:2-oxoglutarate dehydrogenase E1 component